MPTSGSPGRGTVTALRSSRSCARREACTCSRGPLPRLRSPPTGILKSHGSELHLPQGWTGLPGTQRDRVKFHITSDPEQSSFFLSPGRVQIGHHRRMVWRFQFKVISATSSVRGLTLGSRAASSGFRICPSRIPPVCHVHKKAPFPSECHTGDGLCSEVSLQYREATPAPSHGLSPGPRSPPPPARPAQGWPQPGDQSQGAGFQLKERGCK